MRSIFLQSTASNALVLKISVLISNSKVPGDDIQEHCKFLRLDVRIQTPIYTLSKSEKNQFSLLLLRDLTIFVLSSEIVRKTILPLWLHFLFHTEKTTSMKLLKRKSETQQSFCLIPLILVFLNKSNRIYALHIVHINENRPSGGLRTPSKLRGHLFLSSNRVA